MTRATRRRNGTLARRALAVSLGLLADERFGEPRVEPHPVACFGTTMQAIEHRIYADRRGPGVAYAAIGISAAAATGLALPSTALATYVATAGRALREAAEQVAVPLRAGDLDEARTRLPTLVGRDPTGLDEGGIARAVIESLAENTTDAVVAPLWWALVGGAPAVLAHRAINTMDAMVGHRSARYERFGWAAARIDDGANWIPARLTAALVVGCRPAARRAIRRAVRDDAPAHPSPNAGVAEAAFAGALGLRLGGTNRYGDRIDERPELGDGRAPGPDDIGAAIALAADVQRRAALLLAAAGLALTARDALRRGARHRSRR